MFWPATCLFSVVHYSCSRANVIEESAVWVHGGRPLSRGLRTKTQNERVLGHMSNCELGRRSWTRRTYLSVTFLLLRRDNHDIPAAWRGWYRHALSGLHESCPLKVNSWKPTKKNANGADGDMKQERRDNERGGCHIVGVFWCPHLRSESRTSFWNELIWRALMQPKPCGPDSGVKVWEDCLNYDWNVTWTACLLSNVSSACVI